MILGVCGLAGSGKSTVSSILCRERECVEVALADPLKRICKDVFQFTDEQLWGPSEMRNAPDKRYPRVGFQEYPFMHPQDAADIIGPGTEAYLTPRHALQQLGTEWGRRCYDSVWVDYALRVAKTMLYDATYQYSARTGLVRTGSNHLAYGEFPKGVVIPDVRFKNEVKGIKAAGGKVIRVVRPGAGLKDAAAQHQSEKEQAEMPDELFDGVIHNAGTLEALRQCVLRGWEGLTTGIWPEPGELEKQTSELITADMLMGRAGT